MASGWLVFFTSFLPLQFRKAYVPDALLLMLAGTAIDLMLGIIGRLCTDSTVQSERDADRLCKFDHIREAVLST